MTELSGITVAVIGLGASGVAATRLALAKGADVYVSDTRTDDAVAGRGAELHGAGASVDVGRHDLGRVAGAGLVVVSPGIPPDAPVLKDLRARRSAWISEPEFASRFFTGSLIAVTGTNGKTTTTLLVDHLLRAGGLRSAVGGNVGGGLAPAASDLALLDEPPDWYVLEMSSFQLAGVDTFRPDIGVVTNLSPDHLDRYRSVDDYYADKARLFDNADGRCTWVLPLGDEAIARLIGDAEGRRYYFGAGPGAHAFLDDDVLTLRLDTDTELLLPAAELPLLGRHNVDNALAAALTARLAGAATQGIARGLRDARPLPHRLEPIVERNGVLWVNDSKATNVAATRSALASLDRPLILLLGGKDKGEDFGRLADHLVGRARVVLAYGAVGPRIAAELTDALAALVARDSRRGSARGEARSSSGEHTSVELVRGGFGDVVARAAAIARPGEVVLLSPACSSFDMFDSYEHRGRRFVELVRGAA